MQQVTNIVTHVMTQVLTHVFNVLIHVVTNMVHVMMVFDPCVECVALVKVWFCVERGGCGAPQEEEHHDGLEPARLHQHDRQHRGVHGEGDRAAADQTSGPLVLPQEISGGNSEPKQVLT